jgi:hypothetical protein
MRRQQALLLAALGVMVVIAALGQQKQAPDRLLVLEWARKAAAETPPAAVLIEMGRKDAQAKPWSGTATVAGARVVHREGYRFRASDKLVEPDGWQASSHRPLRAPPRMPAAVTLEPFASVGVLLHLADVKPDATLTLSVPEEEIDNLKVPLKDVLAGKEHPINKGRAVVRLVSTATPVETGKTEDDFPAACYGPDGTLWVAHISYTVKEESRRIEAPNLKEQPPDFKAYYTPEFGDQLVVRSYKAGKWSKPLGVTPPGQDLMRCALAADGRGTVWVAYGANRDGKFTLCVRPLNPGAGESATAPKVGAEVALLRGHESALNPALCTTQAGGVALACQVWDATGASRVAVFHKDAGEWTALGNVFGGKGGSQWHAAVAAGPGKGVDIACDHYASGDYDVSLARRADLSGTSEAPGVPLATTSRYEARPSLCYDGRGRLWVAYEEGPERWGKNFGALDEGGNPLYFARTVKVVCLDNGKLSKPAAELPPLAQRGDSPDTGQKVEALPRYAYPQIGIDGNGRVWLTYRQKFGSRYSTHPGSYWLTFARRLDGDKWSEPIEVHHSDGLLDSRPVLLPHAAGGLRILHNTDGRYTTPETIDNQIYMSYVDLPGAPVEPKLVPHVPGKKDEKVLAEAKAEQEAVRRCRDHRIEAGGKKYQLLRGEFHRHTEISWDGGPDGSLEDMWRYALDGAEMDWIGNGDHDNGAGREYPWWLTQKTTDVFHVKGRFTPMFSYERSVAYPHGHRNCVFARRGVRTLPRLDQPDVQKRVGGVHADDTRMLYRYLKELDGICASHTSATGMGTDWRDNDPAAEPVVEIYQGDRMSYEKEAAPRAGYDPKSGKKPANIAGWYPLGFINHALDKGYRLGFQASSDHFSTHISYCIVLAERHDRAAILDGLRKRHCYGATDNIVLDVRSGGQVMGDDFKTNQVPALEIKVLGTAALARVEVLKDSSVVHTFEPGKDTFESKWTDPKPEAGMHYYYVRVQQADGELAWGSPLWIDYAP